MKSKTTAYLLLIFLGWIGLHKFYLGKIPIGILYLLTFGFFGIGCIIDLFTLGTQVDIYNALLGNRFGMPHQNTVNVITNHQSNFADELSKLSKLKNDGLLTQAEFDYQKSKLLK